MNSLWMDWVEKVRWAKEMRKMRDARVLWPHIVAVIQICLKYELRGGR